MLSPYLKRIMIDVFLFIAFGLGIFYAYKVFVDFLISLFHYGSVGTVNISSLAYCLERIVYIFLPLVMLTVVNRFSKMKIFKVMFYIIGICYLLGNSWILYYIFGTSQVELLADKSPLDLIYGSIPSWMVSGDFAQTVKDAWNRLYLFQYDKVLVFNYLVWDSYDLFSVLFSTIQGILYIKLAHNLDTSRGRVMRTLILVSAFALIFPWIYNIIVRGTWIFSGDWANRNILLFFESFFIVMALNLAATSRSFWHDVLW